MDIPKVYFYIESELKIAVARNFQKTYTCKDHFYSLTWKGHTYDAKNLHTFALPNSWMKGQNCIIF